MATPERNAANAHRMKSEGEVRTRMKCPMCHAVIAIDSLSNHLGQNHGARSDARQDKKK
jgi:hypothetical protein